jgi:hypothetical protein
VEYTAAKKLKFSPVVSLNPRIPRINTSRTDKKMSINLIFSSLLFDCELIVLNLLKNAKTYGFNEILY